MSEDKDNKIEIPKSLATLLGSESAQITFDNMKKLCNQNEYTIEGVTYKRKILKPKELVSLFKLQGEMDKIQDVDPQKRMDNLFAQAQIALNGVTKENWENTDIVYMETVIGACLLVSKGFRQI